MFRTHPKLHTSASRTCLVQEDTGMFLECTLTETNTTSPHHLHTHMNMHARTHKHMHTHTHTRAHEHTHTHVCMYALVNGAVTTTNESHTLLPFQSLHCSQVPVWQIAGILWLKNKALIGLVRVYNKGCYGNTLPAHPSCQLSPDAYERCIRVPSPTLSQLRSWVQLVLGYCWAWVGPELHFWSFQSFFIAQCHCNHSWDCGCERAMSHMIS